VNFWTWEGDISQQQILVDFDAENEELQSLVNRQHVDNEQQQPNSQNSQIDESVDEQPQRVRRRPSWMVDYEVSKIEDPLTHFAIFLECDPVSFEEVVTEPIWVTKMDNEIVAIERNNTWELIELPKGQKSIGVKWVYKTKLNEKGKVDKFKARLVAKGYKQEFGIDYTEVFSSVTTHNTIRMVIDLAAQNSWPIFQLDVK